MRPGSNHYPTVGGASYTYNNNGCLTGDGVWTFGYDVLSPFISAVKSGVSASYLYDPMDRQSQKNVGGTKTRFIYNGLQRIAEYDGTAGTLNTRFVYATGLDEPIVEVSSGGTKTFFHRDRLGSIIARTNNSGAVTQRYEYGPYGESAALSGTSFGYTGQRYDAESGLYNYKARYYSPTIGRFLQPDVIGYADGLNLYAYVGNQPVNFVDPLGLAADGGYNSGLFEGSSPSVDTVSLGVWASDVDSGAGGISPTVADSLDIAQGYDPYNQDFQHQNQDTRTDQMQYNAETQQWTLKPGNSSGVQAKENSVWSWAGSAFGAVGSGGVANEIVKQVVRNTAATAVGAAESVIMSRVLPIAASAALGAAVGGIVGPFVERAAGNALGSFINNTKMTPIGQPYNSQ